MTDEKSVNSRRTFLKNGAAVTAGTVALSSIPSIVRAGFPTIVPASVLEKKHQAIKLILVKLVVDALHVRMTSLKHLSMKLHI